MFPTSMKLFTFVKKPQTRIFECISLFCIITCEVNLLYDVSAFVFISVFGWWRTSIGSSDRGSGSSEGSNFAINVLSIEFLFIFSSIMYFPGRSSQCRIDLDKHLACKFQLRRSRKWGGHVSSAVELHLHSAISLKPLLIRSWMGL